MSRFAVRRREGPVCRVAFEPSDRRGVLDGEALDSLFRLASELADDPTLRVAALEGAREDLFAAGADLAAIARLTSEEAGPLAEAGRAAIQAWEDIQATTVAIVKGACFGGALDLVLATDVVVGFPGARFSHPGAHRGIVTGWGGTVRARRRLSPFELHHLFLEAEPVDCERALANGLVDFVPAGDAELEALLSSLAGDSGAELRYLKRVSRAVEGLSPRQALLVEERLRALPDGG